MFWWVNRNMHKPRFMKCQFIKWGCSYSWLGERFAIYSVSLPPLPSLRHPHPRRQSLQVRPQPSPGWHWVLLQKEVGPPQPQLPPPFHQPEFSCCCCASGRLVPVHCNLGIFGAPSSCQALAALSWIPFFFSKWLTSVFQGYCFPSPRLNTVSTTSAVAL